MILSEEIKHLMLVGLISILGVNANAEDCLRIAGTLPKFELRAGTEDTSIPIEHTIVVMQENHSFDHYFGKLSQENFYGREVDGLTSEMKNLDSKGQIVRPHHEPSLCTASPKHDWDTMHRDWNFGKNDQFVINSGVGAIGFYDQSDLNFYYELANRFAISDRYFSSAMTNTFPNRFYLMTGTSFGHIKNDLPIKTLGYDQKTIFEVLNNYGISWKYYRNGLGYLYLFTNFYFKNLNHVATVADFAKDLKSGNLPQVVFIDSDMDGQDEHPSGNVQTGQLFVAERVSELMSSSYWKKSVMFLAYDEGGGFFDHVSPPKACKPDGIEPNLTPKDEMKASFDQYGFRVPFVTVSPFAKPHYVSHITHDHTSILKFIETKYNLPALTARDANADNLMDLFDFNHPHYEAKLPAPNVFAVNCKKFVRRSKGGFAP